MSADYETLMLVSIFASFVMRPVVLGINLTETKRTLYIMSIALFLIVFCNEVMEMTTWHVFTYVMSFTMISAVYDGAYEGGMKHYVKGRVLQYGYLSHIGIISGLIAWSTRWTF